MWSSKYSFPILNFDIDLFIFFGLKINTSELILRRNFSKIVVSCFIPHNNYISAFSYNKIECIRCKLNRAILIVVVVVCCGVRGRALASHTGVRRFKHHDGRSPFLICSQLLGSICMSWKKHGGSASTIISRSF